MTNELKRLEVDLLYWAAAAMAPIVALLAAYKAYVAAIVFLILGLVLVIFAEEELNKKEAGDA